MDDQAPSWRRAPEADGAVATAARPVEPDQARRAGPATDTAQIDRSLAALNSLIDEINRAAAPKATDEAPAAEDGEDWRTELAARLEAEFEPEPEPARAEPLLPASAWAQPAAAPAPRAAAQAGTPPGLPRIERTPQPEMTAAPQARVVEQPSAEQHPIAAARTIEADRGPLKAEPAAPRQVPAEPQPQPRATPKFHKRLGPINFADNLKAGVRAVKKNLLVVMLFTLASNVLVLAIPVYLFQISDRVLTSRSLDTLVMLTVVIVGAVVLQSVLDAIRRFILMRTAVEVAAQLGAPILSAAARASLHSNGREYQTLGDLQQLRSFLVSGTLLSFLDAPLAPLFIVAVFLVHPDLGFIVVASTLVLLTIAVVNQKVTHGPFGEANGFQSRANLHLNSMARNSQIINALAMIPEAVKIWGRDTAGSLKSQIVAQDRNIISAATSKCSRLLTQVAMLGWGAYLSIEGSSPAAW